MKDKYKTDNMADKIKKSPLIGKSKLFYVFALYVGLFFMFFAFVNFYKGKNFIGHYQISVAVYFLVIHYISRKKIYNTILEDISFLLVLIFYVLMLIDGGLYNTGIFWIYSFPIATYFIKGKKLGMLWTAILLAGLLLIAVLQNLGYVKIAFSSPIIYLLIISLLLVGLLIHIYETVREEYQKAIEQKNQELMEITASEQLEIQKREKIEKEKTKTLHDVESKNQLLEETRTAMINLLEDIDEERKISLERADDLQKFKLAVDNASDQIVITDSNGKILNVNRATEQITEFSRKEIIGNTPALWGKQMDKKFYENMWKTIKTYKTVFTGEFTNKTKNGRKYIANVYISPILDEKRKVKYFIGIERDITKAKEVDRAKSEFVSLASHQLRTPLSTINWYTEMILNGDAGKINKEQKNYLSEVYKGSKRMADLVNALLNVSRIELGTFVIEPKKQDIIKIVKDTLKELTPLIKKKKITITEEYSAKKIVLKIDSNLIRMIFQNLLSNAIKYNKENGEVKIEISKQKKYINIKITDTGYGIPVSQQDKIFTKLFRADNIKQKVTEGTGLGLYIVKSILQQSGGMIWFKSAENKSSTFYVAIPIKGMKKKVGTKTLN